jgi:two-component system, sensor histidine kinase and response regulator
VDEVTVLAVNDTPDQLHLLEATLRAAGYTVLSAADGREALEVCRRRRPDIVVSDVMMPEVDGIRLTRALRGDPVLGDTPVLLVSAVRKGSRNAVEGLEAGADGYVEAPYDPLQLTATVARLVERKRAGDEIRRANEQLERRVRERTALLQAAKETLEREVEERRRVEAELARARDAALESLRLKSEFLANVSHEIRTPMHTVIGASGLLLDTPLNPKQRELAEGVKESADLLLVLLNDLLDFSKMEAGKLRLEQTEFDLADALESAAYMFSERARAKGLRLSQRLAPGCPRLVRGDPGRLRQVLANLLSNALKFTDAGLVALTASPAADDGEAVIVRFEVRDTGAGVPPEALNLIFLPFAQADGTTTREHGGAGLGLAICKFLVELMGGEIGVESAPGAGSTFWFTARFGKPSAAAAGARSDLRGLRVLLFNPDGANLDPLAGQLEEWGARPFVCDDAGRALESFEAAAGDPFSLALFDCHEPDSEVFSLAAELRRAAPPGRTRLVLIASSDCDAATPPGAEELFDGRLTKPMRRQTLFNSLLALTSEGRDRPAAAREEEQPGRAPAPPPEVRTALVAEDNLVARRLLGYLLAEHGYAADFAGDGLAAAEAATAKRYSIVLMDCHMPKMDGFAAAAEIRRREAGARRVPIVALTADVLRGTRVKCLRAGMDDYLSKPFTAEQLASVLERWADADDAPPAGRIFDEGERAEEKPAPAAGVSLIAKLRADRSGPSRELISEVVAEFVEDALNRQRLIREAVGRGDREAVRREAHALKGSAGLFGAQQVFALCAALVENSATAPPALLRESLERLETEIALTRESLDELVGPGRE